MQNNKQDQLNVHDTVCGVAMHQRLDPKCANPACPIVFHWLIGGKFFRFPDKPCGPCATKTNASPAAEKKCDGHCVKHFWLCERCSNVFGLAYQKPEGVILKLLRNELPEAEAAANAMVAG